MTDTSAPPRPIDDGLFELDGGEPVLIGSRCTACGTVAFPVQGTCPCCTSDEVARHRLSRSGTLWTWTTQGFRPKSPPYEGPQEFVPFGVGYVELGGEIRVEGILTESDPAKLRIGMRMRVVALPAPGDPAAITFGFAPVLDAA